MGTHSRYAARPSPSCSTLQKRPRAHLALHLHRIISARVPKRESARMQAKPRLSENSYELQYLGTAGRGVVRVRFGGGVGVRGVSWGGGGGVVRGASVTLPPPWPLHRHGARLQESDGQCGACEAGAGAPALGRGGEGVRRVLGGCSEGVQRVIRGS